MLVVKKFGLLFGVLLLVTGCSRDDQGSGGVPISELEVSELEAPVGSGSGRPHLFASEGRVYLSWTEPAGDTLHALRFAVLKGDTWSPARTIAEGSDWFVNWADVPSLVAGADDRLTAHYLAKNGPGPYAYDVRLTQSVDGGRRWRAPVVPHRDGTETEHGFVSLVPWTGGRTAVVWLDGRNTGEHGGHGDHGGGAMTLRFAEIDAEGARSNEAELDERVCDCCGTAAVRTPSGLLVLYRNRSEQEVRDIYAIRLEEGAWSEPVPLHEDGWQIEGCPVNGPAAAAEGPRVAAAWFTAAGGQPRVQVAFSEDEGETFGAPVVVDEGRPLGRVDAVLLEDGRALVSWLEGGRESAEIRMRVVHPDGTAGPSQRVAATSAARTSGFPRMARSGGRVVFAWTETGEPSRVRTAVMALP